MQPVNLAIAGLGFMGATHARATKSINNVRLAAVVDSNDKKLNGDLRDVGGNLGFSGEMMDFSAVRKYKKFEDMLADPEISAVDICFPTHLHVPMAIAALRAGKHVLVEKPLALNEADAELVMREAEASGRILMTAQVLRFFPAYVEAHRLVKSGELGEIRMSWLRRHCAKPAWGGWHVDPARSGGGIFDLLIHDVDFSIWLFGEPVSITAVGTSGPAPQDGLMAATLQYAASGPVNIEGGWHALGPYPFSMSFIIAGEAGTLEFSSANCPLTLSRAGASAPEVLQLEQYDGFEQEVRYFVNCVAENRQPERCPPKESAKAVKVALGMLKTAASRASATTKS